MIYDLHSHSTASDGMLTPTELILRAVEQKVDVLALTDHDTLAGIQEAKIAAESQPIQLISGVEISALWQNKNIHLTALDIDEHHPALIELLQHHAVLREQRAVEIGEKLAKAGIPNAYHGAKMLANGEVTRAHYARFLVQQDYVRNIEHAFKKYLGTGKIAYVKPQWSSISHVIDVTHQAGGVICLAHPLRYKMTARWLRALIEHFKQAGGDGIEVASCGQRPDQRQLIARWASEFDLYASVGSDFHYPTGWIELGKSLTLPTTCKPIWQLFTTQ
ncbi:phosphatase [[Haemophilus] ducreyi]|uniref:S-adenosylmethionine tRNA ribosyltransferase n=2 Tax=Haemophilus ducreyi TaxID=730 RepID=A0AAC8ZAQ9_HAEDC|nr:PHP domain-containing protein [[Haemophilus] ducreyi]AAP96221.1 TrpH-like protein, probable metal-dependent phosphoesterase [[Haemophilus] ducreyi 35000HP]AKO31176.1 S-adenosylmethionine tRNA ribosyltransferase [[Haemophilus] ducreyi]AKO32623.1 S-adenosylmethionine tRNA ribosyltransferase [[Haemophilus] ducreyi]AKO34073.1 S-adenosylmethionine tRNA ribosyltransferase [[Haemophilus] ducreyi]AKO35519.1 S-adenosylmethionine tRNA ribosyltransferase [[Haemophilus] ducreyi]